jgi:dihydrofolate synthase/folylpolyglutamate synthase
MLADKDIQGVIKQVAPHISAWYLASMNNVRGATASVLQKQLRMQAGQEAIAQFDDVASALKAACIEVDNNDRIIVFGSFYTVADAIEALNI